MLKKLLFLKCADLHVQLEVAQLFRINLKFNESSEQGHMSSLLLIFCLHIMGTNCSLVCLLPPLGWLLPLMFGRMEGDQASAQLGCLVDRQR